MSNQGSNEPVLPPGHIILGQYEIVRLIGGGGMGRVYEAQHRSLQEERAIKVLHPGSHSDAILGEAKALTRLNYDGVVRYYELLKDGDVIYLVMENVNGPSLERLLMRGPLPDDEVRALRERLLRTLAAVHSNGLVHRDISPANIILPGGVPERAKLIDFGLASVEPPDGKKGLKGNPIYASPEQYGLFGGRVESQSDLYSLGLVLAEASMGERLPMGDTPNERVAFRKQRPNLPSYLPTDLRAELLPLLEPNPKDRPASAQDALVARASSRTMTAEAAPAGFVLAGEKSISPKLFTASAVGAGLLVGALTWAWKHTRLFL